MAIFHAEPTIASSPRQSLTGTRWQVAQQAAAVTEGVFPALGQVLAARGINTPQEMDTFLNAPLSALHDPMLMPDMAQAVSAVLEVLARGGRMRVFGDYDADGITATALLVRALTALGGKVDWYLPHRVDDGYGLNIRALDDARAQGIELGITVDNGITAHAPLAHAQEIGLRMIVTDHHEPDATLPPAVAVLDPKRKDSVYPFRELAGVGVAYTLLRAVCAVREVPESALARFLDLVTLGTIADVAPLVGENRILVRHGLPMLTLANKKLGLAALLKAVGVRECASCTDVGFQIGPRLNAAGRVAHAATALQLLLTTDVGEAEVKAAELCENNTRRQEEELRTLEQALQMLDAYDLTREKALLLASADWSPGVIGIVASRLLERFHRPCALVAVQDGIGRGSARAAMPFHLFNELQHCTSLLTRFGGHQAAAGFEVAEENIPALREAFRACAERTLSDDDLLPALTVDGWIELTDVTTAFARQVETLEPFGMGNPVPVFAACDVVVQQSCCRGQDGSHLSLTLRSAPGTRPISAIWFRRGEFIERLQPGARVDIAFTVGLNTWQGLTNAQLVVKDIQA